MTLRYFLLALTACACLGCSDPEAPLVLAFEDEFEGAAGTRPSAANWGYDIGTDWGNAQLEYDTDRTSNVSLDGNGHLAIVARQESYEGRAYTSARITTKGKQEFQFGRIEARIKLPAGQGIWPAFWMLGGTIDAVGWPQTGEIDIMEYRGQEPRKVLATVHGPGYSGGQGVTRTYELQQARFDDDFHVFSVEWSASKLDFRVDGALFHSVDPGDVNGEWVFTHPFFIILNVAVGGTFVGAPNAQTVFPQTMLVDWVRVYEPAP